MVKPIPARVMKDTVTYEHYTGTERWGDTWDAHETLNSVRVFPITSLTNNGDSSRIDADTLLLYDVITSSGMTKEFVEKSKVTFEGKVLTVVKVDKLSGFKLHHYEIRLK